MLALFIKAALDDRHRRRCNPTAHEYCSTRVLQAGWIKNGVARRGENFSHAVVETVWLRYEDSRCTAYVVQYTGCSVGIINSKSPPDDVAASRDTSCTNIHGITDASGLKGVQGKM